MSIAAPPIVRCTRIVKLPNGAQIPCRGWLVARTLDPLEPLTNALVCLECAEDYELIAGRLVAITRPAGSPPLAPLPPIDRSGWRGKGRPRKVGAQ